MVKSIRINQVKFCPCELAIVQPLCHVLCQSDRCLYVENVALQREILCQEVVANEWDAVRRPLLITGVLAISQLLILHVQGSILEGDVDRVVDAASVELNEAACGHVELVIISFEDLHPRWYLLLAHLVRNWFRHRGLDWMIDLD